jgi:urease accessory protein
VDTAGTALRNCDARLAGAVGRTARLQLRFERRGTATVLAEAYAEPPFIVRRTFTLDDAAYVIVVCSGPGAFGGDVLRQSIHVGPSARVVLTSQAALQARPPSPLHGYAETRPSAILQQDYTVDDDGELHCDWDPIIPFAGSRVEQRCRVRLARSARLWWSDAVMSGRAGHGERWRFDTLAHELRVERGGALQYLERYRLEPAARDVRGAWIAGDADYFGTALVCHPRADGVTAEALHGVVAAMAGVRAAADAVDRELIAARCASACGVAFAAARAALRREALSRIFESPHLHGRKSV